MAIYPQECGKTYGKIRFKRILPQVLHTILWIKLRKQGKGNKKKPFLSGKAKPLKENYVKKKLALCFRKFVFYTVNYLYQN